MNYFAVGIVIGLGIAVFMYWLARKLSDPTLCPACGSEIVRWDYSRVVCSNPKCGWEDLSPKDSNLEKEKQFRKRI